MAYTVVKWIVGISFIIAGIGAAPTSGLSCFVYILTGCFILPPVQNFIDTGLNIKIPRAVKYVIVFFGILLAAAFGVDNKTEDNSSKESVTTEEKPQDENKKETKKATDRYVYDDKGTLLSSPEDQVTSVTNDVKPSRHVIINSVSIFKKRFNAFMRESSNPLRIHTIKIEPGSVNNTFTYSLNQNIGIVGQLNKEDNSIRSIMMAAQGDGTMTSGAHIIMTMIAIIVSTNPDLIPEERGNILRELKLLNDGADIDDLKTKTFRNDIQYNLFSSEAIGFMFTAQNRNEN